MNATFLFRRLRQRERELGFAIREHFERNEQPPAALRDEYAKVWAQLSEMRRAS